MPGKSYLRLYLASYFQTCISQSYLVSPTYFLNRYLLSCFHPHTSYSYLLPPLVLRTSFPPSYLVNRTSYLTFTLVPSFLLLPLSRVIDSKSASKNILCAFPASLRLCACLPARQGKKNLFKSKEPHTPSDRGSLSQSIVGCIKGKLPSATPSFK
jgi:hypothetical protein